MTEPEPDPIDQLVCAYLDKEASQMNVEGLLGRISDDQRLDVMSARPEESPASRWGFLRMAWWPSIVTLIIVAFLLGRSFHPSSASASTLLRSVRAAHQQGGDRCYRVLHVPEPSALSGSNLKSLGSESLLWTRGDRFWSDCSLGETRLKIGRDVDGALWLSPSRKKGVRFPPDDPAFPKDLETLCQISSVTVPVLLDRVLADFDLRAEAPLAQTGNQRRLVWARLKPGRTHSFLSAASLEVDQETDVLVRMVLWLQKENRPNGTVTYTLMEQSPPGDESYRLESHLDPDATIEEQSFQKPK